MATSHQNQKDKDIEFTILKVVDHNNPINEVVELFPHTLLETHYKVQIQRKLDTQKSKMIADLEREGVKHGEIIFTANKVSLPLKDVNNLIQQIDQGRFDSVYGEDVAELSAATANVSNRGNIIETKSKLFPVQEGSHSTSQLLNFGNDTIQKAIADIATDSQKAYIKNEILDKGMPVAKTGDIKASIDIVAVFANKNDLIRLRDSQLGLPFRNETGNMVTEVMRGEVQESAFTEDFKNKNQVTFSAVKFVDKNDISNERIDIFPHSMAETNFHPPIQDKLKDVTADGVKTFASYAEINEDDVYVSIQEVSMPRGEFNKMVEDVNRDDPSDGVNFTMATLTASKNNNIIGSRMTPFPDELGMHSTSALLRFGDKAAQEVLEGIDTDKDYFKDQILNEGKAWMQKDDIGVWLDVVDVYASSNDLNQILGEKLALDTINTHEQTIAEEQTNSVQKEAVVLEDLIKNIPDYEFSGSDDDKIRINVSKLLVWDKDNKYEELLSVNPQASAGDVNRVMDLSINWAGKAVGYLPPEWGVDADAAGRAFSSMRSYKQQIDGKKVSIGHTHQLATVDRDELQKFVKEQSEYGLETGELTVATMHVFDGDTIKTQQTKIFLAPENKVDTKIIQDWAWKSVFEKANAQSLSTKESIYNGETDLHIGTNLVSIGSQGIRVSLATLQQEIDNQNAYNKTYGKVLDDTKTAPITKKSQAVSPSESQQPVVSAKTKPATDFDFAKITSGSLKDGQQVIVNVSNKHHDAEVLAGFIGKKDMDIATIDLKPSDNAHIKLIDLMIEQHSPVTEMVVVVGSDLDPKKDLQQWADYAKTREQITVVTPDPRFGVSFADARDRIEANLNKRGMEADSIKETTDIVIKNAYNQSLDYTKEKVNSLKNEETKENTASVSKVSGSRSRPR